MAVVRMVSLDCDESGCNESTDYGAWTAYEVREQARKDGWRYRAGKDYCPKHAAKPAAPAASSPTRPMTPFGHPDFHENEGRVSAGKTGCAYCGKAVPHYRDQPVLMVTVLEGGNRFLMEGEDPQVFETDNGFMGGYEVGPDCARKLRAAGVQVG